MSANPRMFLLIKPECAPYVHQIEPVLRQNNLAIESLYFISDWLPIARELYKQRIACESLAFKAGFEGHLWLSSFLFGCKAVLLILQSDAKEVNDLVSIAHRANQAKAEFRDLLPYTRDGRIVLVMNLELIEALHLYEGAVRGLIGIKQKDGDFKPIETANNGSWDYFYLKYIHVPDQNMAEILYEWDTLVKMQVINESNRLSSQDWQTIQTLNVFMPPSSSEGTTPEKLVNF